MRTKDWGSRKDDNHREIRSYFEALGCRVKDVSSIPGFVDLIVKRGRQVRFVEIKDPTKVASKQRLTKGEQEFWDYWGEDPLIAKTYADVIRIVGEMI